MKCVGALSLALLAGLWQVTSGHAGDATNRPACAQGDPADHSSCVDDLLGEMIGPPGPSPSDGPNWVISETTSPVDYRPQVTARTTASPSSRGGPSSLTIRCRAQRTELLISVAALRESGLNGAVNVAYRINEQPAVERRWRTVEAGKDLAFPGDAARFVQLMPTGGQIAFKVLTGSGPRYEDVFQLAGLESVRRKIATTCAWPRAN